jgi:hypothetical protein
MVELLYNCIYASPWCDVTKSQMVTIKLPALSVTPVLSLMGVQELTARARCAADAVGAYGVCTAYIRMPSPRPEPHPTPRCGSASADFQGLRRHPAFRMECTPCRLGSLYVSCIGTCAAP